jgi:flagellar M-ring protein FliF
MNNRQIFLAGITTVAFLLVAAIWWMLAPSWVPLFSYTLPESSKKEVLDLLNQEGINYKIDAANNSILMKSQDIQSAHKLLANNDMPKAASDGLEMFNNSDYGLSEFAQNINYQRGMEEELARTIMRMNGVKNVRIHLTIKKDSLFEDRKQEPKASVVITFKEDIFYDASKIKGIQEVISAAIPNLPPKNVVIVTDKGDILSTTEGGDSSSTIGFIEAKYRLLLTSLLDGVLGEGKYKLSVNVHMDYKKRVSIKENYYPDSSSGKGFLAKKKSTSRTETDAGSGVTSPAQNTSEEEYLFSKEKSEIVYPIGEISKISIGLVVLDSIDQNSREAIGSLIRTSLGMDSVRGDSINIISADLRANLDTTSNLTEDKRSPEILSKEANAPRENKITQYFYISLALIFCFFASSILFLSLYIKAKSNSAKPLSPAEKKQLVSDLIRWVK